MQHARRCFSTSGMRLGAGAALGLTTAGGMQGMYLWSKYRPLPEAHGPLRERGGHFLERPQIIARLRSDRCEPGSYLVVRRRLTAVDPREVAACAVPRRDEDGEHRVPSARDVGVARAVLGEPREEAAASFNRLDFA